MELHCSVQFGEVRRQFHGDVDLGIEPVPGLFECIQKASNNIPIPPDEDVRPRTRMNSRKKTTTKDNCSIALGALGIQDFYIFLFLERYNRGRKHMLRIA